MSTIFQGIVCPYENCRAHFGLPKPVYDRIVDDGSECRCPICGRSIQWGGGKSRRERELEAKLKAAQDAATRAERELRSEREDLIRAHSQLDRMSADRRSCPLCGKRTRLRVEHKVQAWMEEHLMVGHNATPNEIKLLTERSVTHAE